MLPVALGYELFWTYCESCPNWDACWGNDCSCADSIFISLFVPDACETFYSSMSC